jgi:hypothetical protein
MRLLMTLTILTFPLIGCGQKEPTPVIEEALFCDVEEPRKFSQAEIDWRSANAPWNLARDYRTNLTWDRECADKVRQSAAG